MEISRQVRTLLARLPTLTLVPYADEQRDAELLQRSERTLEETVIDDGPSTGVSVEAERTLCENIEKCVEECRIETTAVARADQAIVGDELVRYCLTQS